MVMTIGLVTGKQCSLACMVCTCSKHCLICEAIEILFLTHNNIIVDVNIMMLCAY